MGLAQLYCYHQVKVAWSIAKTHKFLAHLAYTLVYEGATKTLLHRDETSHLAASITDKACYCTLWSLYVFLVMCLCA